MTSQKSQNSNMLLAFLLPLASRFTSPLLSQLANRKEVPINMIPMILFLISIPYYIYY